jgi:thiol:disulfide interchange protein DsbD
MKRQVFLMGIALFVLSPFLVFGQLLDPVNYSIIEAPDTVRAGESFNVIVEATIDENWHLYSISNDPDAGPFPTQFSSPSSNIAITGQIEESDAQIAFDPNFETNLGWHSNSAQFKIPVAFSRNLQGLQPIILEVLYQVCDDRSCLPPKTKEIEAEVFLAGVSDSPFVNNLDSDDKSILWIAEFIFFGATAWLTLFFIYRLLRKKFIKSNSTE